MLMVDFTLQFFFNLLSLTSSFCLTQRKLCDIHGGIYRRQHVSVKTARYNYFTSHSESQSTTGEHQRTYHWRARRSFLDQTDLHWLHNLSTL